MAMTPEDLLNKEFPETKFRPGYDKDEVDDFLDEVVVEWRRIIQENEDLTKQVESLQEQLDNSQLTWSQMSSPMLDSPDTPGPPPRSPAPLNRSPKTTTLSSLRTISPLKLRLRPLMRP